MLVIVEFPEFRKLQLFGNNIYRSFMGAV